MWTNAISSAQVSKLAARIRNRDTKRISGKITSSRFFCGQRQNSYRRFNS